MQNNDKLVGKSIDEFIAKDDLEHVTNTFKSLKFDQSKTIEATVVNNQNQCINVAISANHLSIAGQTVIQVFLLDITKRKQMEAALYEEKERAQITLSSIADGVITTDQNAIVTSINPKAELLTGWKSVQAYGQAVTQVISISDEKTHLPLSGIIEKCLHKGQSVELAGSMLLSHRHDGESSVEISVAPLRDPLGHNNGTVIVIHDVSEARKMAEEMHFLDSFLSSPTFIIRCF